MVSRLVLIAAAAAILAGCATPYQEMGLTGGVSATQITSDTVQIIARGNGYSDPDTIQRFALRKAAETTVAAGFDVFFISDQANRSQRGTESFGYATGGYGGLWGSGTSWEVIKPGQTLMVKMLRYPAPSPMPPGMYDAREILKFLAPPIVGKDAPTKDSKDCAKSGGVVKCV